MSTYKFKNRHTENIITFEEYDELELDDKWDYDLLLDDDAVYDEPNLETK